MIGEYYGIDWLIFVLFLIHMWLLGRKNRNAFVFGAMGCLGGIIVGILASSYAIMAMNAVFSVMHVRTFWKWSDETSS